MTSGILFASPVLAHNLQREGGGDGPANQLRVSLLPGPFRSHRPAIPTANAVVVARVASPLTTTRRYAKTCLDGLKNYFQTAARPLKQNDIIAVPINVDKTDDDIERLFHSTHWLFNFTRRRNNEIAYFVITNIESDVTSAPNPYDSVDYYTGSTLGELGCWVDTTSTRIVQAGLEHSWIPFLGTYADLGGFQKCYC